ncbi:MAG: copper chaperone PCu(A)C [Pseudomonadota bacterium]
MFRRLTVALLLVLSGCSGPPEPGAGAALEVTDARVRTPVPGQDRTAGYFTARNPGDAAVTIRGARSDAAEAVEIHESRREGDRMRMVPLDEVVVAPGEAVRFEPGGKHLMLLGIEQLGESVEIVLEHDGGETLVRFETVPVGGE